MLFVSGQGAVRSYRCSRIAQVLFVPFFFFFQSAERRTSAYLQENEERNNDDDGVVVVVAFTWAIPAVGGRLLRGVAQRSEPPSALPAHLAPAARPEQPAE